MATPPITPVGFIKQRIPDGAVFTLAQPGGTVTLKRDDHITVWSHSPGTSSTVRILGFVTSLGPSTGTFTVIKSETEGPWPVEADPLEPGSPVYRALWGTYEPDPES